MKCLLQILFLRYIILLIREKKSGLIKEKLRENLNIGKPLKFNWFREKKFGKKRLYYLTNEKNRKAVLLAFGTKRNQQDIINHIIENREDYLTLIT